MNIGEVGEKMYVKQNYVVGAAAILGGYASGDEYLTNNGTIEGNISVYSYFNNEGNVSTVVNNHIIDGDIRLENGSMIKNGVDGLITGNVTIRGALTESAGESSLHNEGDIKGNIEIAEGAHLYNSGEVYGNVTVKSGGTLEMNCNEEGHSHGGVIHGDVYLYPDGLIYADVKPTQIDGTIYLEYEEGDEADRDRMLDVLDTCGITYANVVATPHVHSEELDETEEDDKANKCADTVVILKTCKTCGKVVERVESEPTGHTYYVDESSAEEATCTKGAMETIRCENCSAFNNSKGLKVQVSAPNGHHYVENEDLHIPATEYGTGHEYYICTECGDLLQIEVPQYAHNANKHSFQNDEGELDETKGVRKTEPTCTTAGEMTFTCDGCGAEISLAIPATGHRYPNPRTANYETDYVQIDSKESTCSTAGYIKYAPVCENCGKNAQENGDNTSNNNLTYQVNLPKLEHIWSDWEDTVEGDYLCTAERDQERKCELCGDTEKRIGGEKSHTWDSAHVTCTVCGYTTSGHHIEYMPNGGTAPKSLADIMDNVYTPSTGDEVKTAPLWQPSANEPWTKQTANGQAVFIGWCGTDLGAAPLEAEPEEELISEVVIPEDADAIVFAVWAVDRNKNFVPDYRETTVSIIYDINGGDGVVPARLTGVLPGADYPLETAPELKKGGAIFAGWSLERTDKVITDAVDPDSLEIIKSLLISPYTVPGNANEDITLYAVYAQDNDNSGKPDYCERALHVEYYINGGNVHAGYTVDDNGMFYVCNDYHLPGTNAALLAVEYGRTMIYRDKAVLVGWSQDEHVDFVTGEEMANELSIGEVSLTGAESNAKVYALWAADENENHVADYMESMLMHTYHRNQFLAESSGRTIQMGWKLDVKEKEPERQNNILPGMGVELADNDYFGAVDLVDDKGDVKGHYIQIGWSAYSHGACASMTDYNNWLIAGEANGYTEGEKYYRIIYDTRYQNAFALWASDENTNGIADFKEMKCTVTLNLNGGTPTENDFPEKTELTINEQFTFPADPAKPGHAFKGWFAAGDEHLYKAGESVTVTDDVTYTAQYEPTTHTVTLDLNGGTAGEDFEASSTVNEGESFTFPADPTKDGFNFLGWSAEGDENLYRAGDTVTVNADVTYTAQYEVNVCKVTLDLNGGTAGEGFTADNTVNEGESFIFPADPTKDGYTFKGWSAKGDEHLYKAGDTVEVTDDVTYTAQYEANTYKVTLDLNGGTAGEGFTADNTVNKGESFTFSADPAKDGYTFKGWSAVGDEHLYKAGDTVEVTADVTYTAQYEEIVVGPNTFKVTLDLNGGTAGEGFTAENTVNEGESFTFPADPTKAGFNFLGWSAEGDENLYKAGDTVAVSADVIYTAQYEEIVVPNTFRVTLDLNGGTAGEGFTADNTVNEGESFTFPADPTKAGFNFLGWSAEGDENLYKAGDTVEVTADVTYTAQYEEIVVGPKTFKVTLELRGGRAGEGFKAENIVNEGESFTFPADPSRTGYTFRGWSADGGENLYRAGDTVAVTADITFAAQWSLASSFSPGGSVFSTYTVWFETNGGSHVPSQTITLNGLVKEPTPPTKDGYTFAGWYSDTALTKKYDFASKVTSSFTLYAKWNDAEPGGASAPNPGTGGAALNSEDHYAYIVGYPDGSVQPNETITRAEVAAIFYRLMSDESRNMFMSNQNGYSDTAPGDWFNTAVSTMSAASVIKGYEDGTFAPDQPITRAEFAAMAARFDSGEYSGEDKFPDISGHWARKEINRAAQKGWVTGYQDGTFAPDRYITRAEAMRLVNRVMGRIPSAEHLLADMTVWPDNSDKSVWYYADVQEATNSHYYEKNGEYEVWTAMRETRNWAELGR